MEIQSRDVEANGLRFHVNEAGEGEKLALCLHGFPELGFSWRHQLPCLAKLGYRAWAPDLRGYGRSDRPTRLRDYAIETLMDDVAGLIDAAGVKQATLIAHDWGGMIAWCVAMRRPELLERLIILNMPHPAAFSRALRRPAQLLRSTYIVLFQLPWIAERYLAKDDYHAIRAAFASMAVDRSRFPEEVLRVYRDAAAQPRALWAMLAYYRAYVLGGGMRRQKALGTPVIDTPTLMLWGEADTALGRETTLGTDAFVSNLTLRYIPSASHWVQQEAPEVVNAMMEAWLQGERVPEAWELPLPAASRPPAI